MTREKIAERLDAVFGSGAGGHPTLADAVRALPVISRCSDCFWLAIDMTPRGNMGICTHDGGNDMVIGRVDGAPPARCPLRGKR